MTTMTIQTSQVIDLARVSKEQLRYWKKNLRPIARRDGRKGGYNFSEVVALAAISQAMAQFQLDISRFQEPAEAFFDAVDTIIRDEVGDGLLYLSDDQVSIGHPIADAGEVSLIFRIDHLAQRLRDEMTSPEPSPQFSLM